MLLCKNIIKKDEIKVKDQPSNQDSRISETFSVFDVRGAIVPNKEPLQFRVVAVERDNNGMGCLKCAHAALKNETFEASRNIPTDLRPNDVVQIVGKTLQKLDR